MFNQLYKYKNGQLKLRVSQKEQTIEQLMTSEMIQEGGDNIYVVEGVLCLQTIRMDFYERKERGSDNMRMYSAASKLHKIRNA